MNPYDATKLALQMSDDAGVWDRPLGLQGVWGSIIYDWLDRLLPDDAGETVNEDVSLCLACMCLCILYASCWTMSNVESFLFCCSTFNIQLLASHTIDTRTIVWKK